MPWNLVFVFVVQISPNQVIVSNSFPFPWQYFSLLSCDTLCIRAAFILLSMTKSILLWMANAHNIILPCLPSKTKRFHFIKFHRHNLCYDLMLYKDSMCWDRSAKSQRGLHYIYIGLDMIGTDIISEEIKPLPFYFLRSYLFFILITSNATRLQFFMSIWKEVFNWILSRILF